MIAASHRWRIPILQAVYSEQTKCNFAHASAHVVFRFPIFSNFLFTLFIFIVKRFVGCWHLRTINSYAYVSRKYSASLSTRNIVSRRIYPIFYCFLNKINYSRYFIYYLITILYYLQKISAVGTPELSFTVWSHLFIIFI